MAQRFRLSKARRTSTAVVPWHIACLWFVQILLVPFYVFESGQPQPSDGVALLVVVFTFLSLGVDFGANREHVRRMLFAVWYVAFVGIFHALFSQNLLLLSFPAFYIFNALVACSAIALFNTYGDAFLRLTLAAATCSVLAQLILLPLAPDREGVRATLFFNNPNQLGYFAVTCACLLTLPIRVGRVQRILQMCALAVCVFLAVLSLSKAALGSIVILLAFVFVRRRILIACVALVLVVAYAVVETEDLSTQVYDRVTVGQDDDNIYARGYDRIFRHPEYLIFGAGEGETQRFDIRFQGEIHSSFGTMLFSYGLIGSGLLLWFFWGAIRRRPAAMLASLVPLAVYGLTHNGLRSTIAWEYVALATCVGGLRKDSLSLGGALPRSRARAPTSPRLRLRD